MRLALMLAAVLTALVITSGCALPSIELPRPVVNDPTAAPTAVVQAQATPPPATPSAPLATSVPLPTQSPIPTLPPELTNPLAAEQEALITLYRRVNPAVVSIEVVADHPPVGGTPFTVPTARVPVSCSMTRDISLRTITWSKTAPSSRCDSPMVRC